MEFIKTTAAEVDKVMREERRKSGVKGWKTRRERGQLRTLYSLADAREQPEPFGARYYRMTP
jgi:hypothetical protein